MLRGSVGPTKGSFAETRSTSLLVVNTGECGHPCGLRMAWQQLVFCNIGPSVFCTDFMYTSAEQSLGVSERIV